MIDLLNPSDLREHYQHQIRQTIAAYNPMQIVLGEALQNAIDAVVQADGGNHRINIELNLDERSVTVTDDGIGFPNDPTLLFLGGGRKRDGNRKLFGFVGVGIKVVLFSSQLFRLRTLTDADAWCYEINDAYRFDHGSPPDLRVPEKFPLEDPSPLPQKGTQVYYIFPARTAHDPFERFLQDAYEQCLPHGNTRGFGKVLQASVDRALFPTRFAAMMAAFLRRYTYAGDVWNALGGKLELANTSIAVRIVCSDPAGLPDPSVAELFDGKCDFSFEISPEYLLASEVCNWVSSQDRPGLYDLPLGRGGEGLTRTWRGFNVRLYTGAEDYERLVIDRRGQLPDNIEEYRDRLFPRVNGIVLTIGRIPDFEGFLPGGSQRVISANGVVTTHEIDLTRGRNQEYVRCFDLVIDVDAQLNYGKTQITDNHLVNRIRRFVNDAYARTIQAAAGNWVGRIQDTEEEYDFFLRRRKLGLEQFAIRKIPRDENDVIALFFELLGRGYLSGYQVFGLSQMDPYDGRFLIQKVGDDSPPPIPQDDRQLVSVEFKVTAASVIRDLEQETKDARQLKLLIAWDEGVSRSDQFGFADIEYSRFYPDQVYPGVTRYIQNTKSGAQIQVLLLEDLVNEIKRDRA